MSDANHIIARGGDRIEIEAGDYIVAANPTQHSNFDRGEVLAVADGYVEVAWQSGTRNHPIRSLDGCDLYRTEAAAREALDAALVEPEPERDPHRGGRGIRAPGSRWSVMLRASEDERATIERLAEEAGMPVGRFVVERTLLTEALRDR